MELKSIPFALRRNTQRAVVTKSELRVNRVTRDRYFLVTTEGASSHLHQPYMGCPMLRDVRSMGTTDDGSRRFF